MSEKSKATKQRMIEENKYTGGFRPKFGYDVDDNGYLVPCEKEQSIIRYNICNMELQSNITDF